MSEEVPDAPEALLVPCIDSLDPLLPWSEDAVSFELDDWLPEVCSLPVDAELDWEDGELIDPWDEGKDIPPLELDCELELDEELEGDWEPLELERELELGGVVDGDCELLEELGEDGPEGALICWTAQPLRVITVNTKINFLITDISLL